MEKKFKKGMSGGGGGGGKAKKGRQQERLITNLLVNVLTAFV